MTPTQALTDIAEESQMLSKASDDLIAERLRSMGYDTFLHEAAHYIQSGITLNRLAQYCAYKAEHAENKDCLTLLEAMNRLSED